MAKDVVPKKKYISGKTFAVTLLVVLPVGFVLGYLLGHGLKVEPYKVFDGLDSWFMNFAEYWVGALGAVLGIIMAAPLYLLLSAISRGVESKLKKFSSKEILMGMVGLLIGVLLAVLIALLINIPSPGIKSFIGITLGIVLGYVGLRIGARILYDLLPATNLPRPARMTSHSEQNVLVLDSSSIIDGRILDVVRTGFIQGKIIVPKEVLSELSRIADSDDVLKQNRGKRGLDILSALQKEKNVTVSIPEGAARAGSSEDGVLAAAKENNARIITNDSNFGKLAVAQSQEVLNINDLGNALKPIALPGEKMTVKVVKVGKDPKQGVAFTPDGTMIVVDGGAELVGRIVDVTVTTSLQTSAGRIIFVK